MSDTKCKCLTQDVIGEKKLYYLRISLHSNLLRKAHWKGWSMVSIRHCNRVQAPTWLIIIARNKKSNHIFTVQSQLPISLYNPSLSLIYREKPIILLTREKNFTAPVMSTSSSAALTGASPDDHFRPPTAMMAGDSSDRSSSSPSMTQAFPFSSGNPRIEETRGVMHLFPNNDGVSDLPVLSFSLHKS